MYQTLKTWKVGKQKIQFIQIGEQKYLKDESGQCEIKGDEEKIIKHIDFRIKKIYTHKPAPGEQMHGFSVTAGASKGYRKNWPSSCKYNSVGNKI